MAELCATTVALMKDPKHDISTTMPAPDFVGGGQILYDEAQMREVYENGRGSIKVRARYNVVPGENMLEITQIPPMYSAIKINGQKLYDLARKGKEVERKPRNITIFELELLEQVSETDYLLRCRCSKGTYLRTLCHDIGQALGCGGTMFSLRRTMAAGYTLAEAVSLEDVQAQGEALLRPVESMFTAYPLYTLPSPGKEARVRNGNPITVPELADGTYRVHGKNGEFLCLSRAENGTLTSIKNFFGA